MAKTQGNEQRRFKFEHARFFNHVPSRTLDSLTDTQRRDIAHTIFELQRNNPRILQEIYIDNPFVADEAGSPIFRRVKRRFYLLVLNAWNSVKRPEFEGRKANRLADFIFMFLLSGSVFGLVVALILSGYFAKSALGIDLVPGVHLFCTD